jgi:Spy/CpxP family protein refolding chaperone
LTKLKIFTTLAGAAALVLAVAAAPAVFSQDEPPMGDEQMHMHQGQMGQMPEMPEGHAEMMAQCQAMMAEHQAAMKEHMARMDQLVAEMNQATGDAKTDAVAAVLNEMWSQHQGMHEGSGPMGGMMGTMGCGMGMMHGHAGCGCAMHASGECPMMKQGTAEEE